MQTHKVYPAYVPSKLCKFFKLEFSQFSLFCGQNIVKHVLKLDDIDISLLFNTSELTGSVIQTLEIDQRKSSFAPQFCFLK